MSSRRLLAAALLAVLGCNGSGNTTDAGVGGNAGGRAGSGGAGGVGGAGGRAIGQGGGGGGGVVATAGSSGAGASGHGGGGAVGGQAGAGGQGGAVGAGGQAGVAGQSGDGGADPLQAVPVVCTGCTAVRIGVEAQQMVFDPVRRLLYLTLAGAAPVHPNTIVTVDVAAAAVAAVTPIGSNPNALALSDDASTLWVGVDGALSLRKVTLTTTPPTVGPLVQVPQPSGGLASPATAASIAVLPGSATTIAVETLAGRFFGTYLLDDGVARTGNTTSDLIQATQIVAGPPGYFFGYNAGDTGFELFTYTASSAGLSQTEVRDLLSGFGTTIVYDRNHLFARNGDILDVSAPSSPVAAGMIGAGPIAIRDANHLLLISTGMSGTTSGAQMYLIDRTTLSTAGMLALPTEFSSTTFGGGTIAFAYVGGNRVAILEALLDQRTQITSRYLYLLDASLVSGP